MTEKIRAHIDALFGDAPDTRRVRDAREELLSGCLDKYADLTGDGRSPEEAYIAVISGIGDVDELLRAIGKLDATDPRREEKNRKKRALFISAGVFLFIMSIVAVAVITSFVDGVPALEPPTPPIPPLPVPGSLIASGNLAVVVFLSFVAVAIFVLMYGVMSTRVKVARPAASMSGEIQEQLTVHKNSGSLIGSVSSSMWTLLVVIYLCLGFFFDWWHPGWLIFPVGAMLQMVVIMALGKPSKRRGGLIALFWVLVADAYLILSFLTDRWDITWLLFPIAACAQQLLHLYRVWRDSDEK